MHVVNVEPGNEVIATVEQYVNEKNIQHAAIVSFFGAFDSCCVSNMPKEDAKQDINEEYSIPLEVTGCGDVVDGKAHIHVTASSTDNLIIAGHLHWAKVETWFVKVYLQPM